MKPSNNSPLTQAAKIVGGARLKNYGKPYDNHSNTAELWSAWFSRKMRKRMHFSAFDVCMFNILQKCSREANEHLDDNFVDICGYAENDYLCRKEQHKRYPFLAEANEKLKKAYKLSDRQKALSELKPSNTSPFIDSLNRIIEHDNKSFEIQNRVIYVASAYTNGGKITDKKMKERNIEKANSIGAALIVKGWLPHLPLAATSPFANDDNMCYDDFMELDRVVLESCGALYRDKSVSAGAEKEVKVAEKIGIPVFTNLNDIPSV